MVRHDGACRIYGAVRHDDDKDGASVSVETVLNKMGDSVPEKGRLLLRNHLLTNVPLGPPKGSFEMSIQPFDNLLNSSYGNDNLKVTHCDHAKMTHPCFS